MKKQEHSHFMPREAVAGLFYSKSGAKAGFVTCKYMDKGWLKTSTFKRLTNGYMPSQSKDPEIQLKKTLYNKVMPFSNEPVEGFRVVGEVSDIYLHKTGEYKKSPGDFIVADPRGFEIGIRAVEFAQIVSSCDMSGGYLSGKYSYAWTASDGHCMTLLKEGTPEFKDAQLCLDEFERREKPKDVSVKKNELVVGHAYSAAKVLEGDWVYAGIHDTYSDKCHIDAFDTGQYDVENSMKKEKEWSPSGYYSKFKTSTGRMVFFPFKFDRHRPWVARADISGVFKRETSLPKSFHFASSGPDGDPPTLESINAALESSAAFQKIDFGRFRREDKWEPMSQDIGGSIFDRKEFSALTMFPFDSYYYALVKAGDNCVSSSYRGCWLKVSVDRYSYTSSRADDWRVTNLTRLLENSGNVRFCGPLYQDKYTSMTWQGLYSLVSPVVPVMYFENGKRVPQHIAMVFVPAAVRSMCNKYC